jgi:hypothetical protein
LLIDLVGTALLSLALGMAHSRRSEILHPINGLLTAVELIPPILDHLTREIYIALRERLGALSNMGQGRKSKQIEHV